MKKIVDLKKFCSFFEFSGTLKPLLVLQRYLLYLIIHEYVFGPAWK